MFFLNLKTRDNNYSASKGSDIDQSNQLPDVIDNLHIATIVIVLCTSVLFVYFEMNMY